MLVVIIIIMLSAAIYFITKKTAAIAVTTAEVDEDSIEAYVQELGTVEVRQQEVVYTNLAGRVNELLIDIGDKVKKGDILARIDSTNQESDIRILEAQKAALTAAYKVAIEPVDANQIKKAELNITELEKKMDESKENLDKQKILLDEGIISDEFYQNAFSGYETLQSQHEQAILDLDLLKKPVSSNISKRYEAQLSEIEVQIEALKSKSGDFVITAPFDGTILSKNITQGSYVMQGTDILEIGNLDNLYIESDVLVEDISGVNEGAKVKIESKDLGITDAIGTLIKIYPEAFSKVSDLGVEQKRIKTEITLNEPVENIRPGYDLDIKIITASKDKTLIIPENALFEMEGKEYVFVNANGIASLREVETGIESDRRVEITKGLSKGEHVILSPDGDLRDGLEIKEES